MTVLLEEMQILTSDIVKVTINVNVILAVWFRTFSS